MGNRNHRSARTDGLPPYVDAEFAGALSGDRRRDRASRQQQKDDRKARQLCRQAYQVLSLALAGECGDDVLRELTVESVEPAPGASRLIVRVAIPSRGIPISIAEVMERFERVNPLLRRLVAQAITRKRAPELTFVPTSSADPTGPPASASGGDGCDDLDAEEEALP